MIETYFDPGPMEIQDNITTTPLSVLPTDASLEMNFGHLNPDEVTNLEIKAAQKARIAQLQIEALRTIRDNGGEMLGWLACYRSTFSENDDYI